VNLEPRDRALFADGVWVIELASLSDPEMLPATVAVTLGLKLSADEVSAERVARAAMSRQLLIVLDNCEHLAGAAADMAEALLSCGLSVRVIATSREPLKADGECVYRVRPLACNFLDFHFLRGTGHAKGLAIPPNCP
jgi:predicted ATPase